MECLLVHKGINLEDTLCAWQKHTFSDDAYYFINWTGKLATQNDSEGTKYAFKNSHIYSTYLCKFANKMNKYSIIIF